MSDLCLTVERGEFFAVLGPNAAGKTTTIKILTGLIKPNAGRARVAGFDVQEQPLEMRRRLDMLIEKVINDKVPPPEVLRSLRAVQILGQLESADARQVLQTLAQGAPGHRLTRQAQAAVKEGGR